MTVTVVAHIPQIKKNEFELLTRRARNDGMMLTSQHLGLPHRVFLVALGLIAACSAGPPEDGARVADETSAEYQKELLGGLEPANETRTEVTGLQLVPQTSAPSFRPPPFDYSAETTAGPIQVPAGTDVVELQFLEGRVYAVDVDDADLDRLASEAKALGASEPVSPKGESSGGSKTEPGSHPQGWSWAVDNRVRKAVPDGYPTTHPALAKIGEMSTRGTGQLFGRRLVMTAAHVICQGGTCWYPGFIPRHTTVPSHSHPYGEEPVISAWVGGGYLANNCHITYNYATCAKEDWAVLLLPSTAFSGWHPGWMGFITTDEATLQSYDSRVDGYPVCGAPHDPVGCLGGTVWGQNSKCFISRFHNPDGSGGYKNLFAHGCDLQGGYSGSAVYNFIGGAGPYILGINFWEDCGTCAGVSYPVLAYPNISIRINDWLFNYMLSKRAQYP